jgi:DNA-binding transcriptional LysR family regulator
MGGRRRGGQGDRHWAIVTPSTRRLRRCFAQPPFKPPSQLREKPAGTVRITTSHHAAETILWPALARLLSHYPDIRVELSIDPALTDIVAERYDAGVRLGEQVAKDMIAVRIGPDMRMAVVGATSYFADRPTPKTPHDLTHHACINLRLPTLGGLYAREFGKDGRELNVRVDGTRCP